jgi:hypothetical protein
MHLKIYQDFNSSHCHSLHFRHLVTFVRNCLAEFRQHLFFNYLQPGFMNKYFKLELFKHFSQPLNLHQSRLALLL